ncbi:MAG: RNA pseudouridine synthase [Proteobacteria bacterium]|nr:RNA pseudouridine synthase [Pseudomonadota bacterium]
MSPRRFQPRETPIIHEDRDILVVDKKSGLLTIGNEKIKENTAYFLLNNYVQKGNRKSKNRIFIVHRLDRDTSGVIIFAKTDKAKEFLQSQWSGFKKSYYAVVQGKLAEKEGVITSYLAENSVFKMYSVQDPEKGKLATTAYKVLKESEKLSLLEIDLKTGRKNQIRVHLAEKGHPVAGDKKYGNGEKGIRRLALHAASLTIVHPFSKETMTFQTKLPHYFRSLLNR